MAEIKDFCQKLGSISPTPGGGAAAGICLSMGAACAEKAARFSLEDTDQNFIEAFVLDSWKQEINYNVYSITFCFLPRSSMSPIFFGSNVPVWSLSLSNK